MTNTDIFKGSGELHQSVFKITNQLRKTVFWTVYRLPCATQSIIYMIRMRDAVLTSV